MNSCNTIRSVELLYYYYYWCTYILARYRKCIVILLPKSLVVSFVLLNLFGLYFMFFLFSFDLISLPLFQRTVTQIYHIFPMRKNSIQSLQLQAGDPTAYIVYMIIMQKEPFVYFMGRFQLCFVCSIILLFNVSLNS